MSQDDMNKMHSRGRMGFKAEIEIVIELEIVTANVKPSPL
jgi:hypothetical protein